MSPFTHRDILLLAVDVVVHIFLVHILPLLLSLLHTIPFASS